MKHSINSEATHGQSMTQRAGKKEWTGLAVIALPCALYSMDLTVLNLAVPHLTADLQPSSSELLWIVDIYGFMVAGFLIPMGTLGDRIGRRLLLMIGAAAFGLASIFAAYSISPEMLIVARAVLGIAGATLAPSTLSLIRNMFVDSKQRTFAIGVWVASYSAGGALGPVVGGILKQPMIDLNLFRSHAFSAALTIYTFITFIAFGGFIFIFQYLQLVQGNSPIEAGLLAVPSFGGFIVGSVFAPMLVHRIPSAKVITYGLILAAVGFGMVTQVEV